MRSHTQKHKHALTHTHTQNYIRCGHQISISGGHGSNANTTGGHVYSRSGLLDSMKNSRERKLGFDTRKCFQKYKR